MHFWVEDERLLSNCNLRGANHGHHVFEDMGPHPVFTSRKTWVRQVLKANAPALAGTRLFEHDLGIDAGDRYKLLRKGTWKRIAFPASDFRGSEGIKVIAFT